MLPYCNFKEKHAKQIFGGIIINSWELKKATQTKMPNHPNNMACIINLFP